VRDQLSEEAQMLKKQVARYEEIIGDLQKSQEEELNLKNEEMKSISSKLEEVK
jgi:predicted  nucleic acid-binding Zn-ribbon protein